MSITQPSTLFDFTHHATANQKSIILGTNYRITILFDRLFRLEFQENGLFEDRPSQTFWHRNQPIPSFELVDERDFLIIKTQYWQLSYKKNMPFTKETLSFTSYITHETFNYSTEQSNLFGTARTLDTIDGATPLENGLFSKEGYTIIDDSARLVYEHNFLTERTHACQDIYFFGYHDDFKQGLSDYYALTGKTPLIPKYALGNWWSRYWNYTADELKETVLNFEKRNIPLSVCIIDMDWHHVDIDPKYGSGWTGYTWNQANFKKPQAFISWLHQRHIKTALNLHPADGIRAHEACYPLVAAAMGIDPKTEAPIAFDCSNPTFMDAYFKYAHKPHEAIGVDFWWLDWQQGSHSKLKGLDPLWALNHMHFLYAEKEKRGFIFSRWPGLGGHRYPIGFSGDTKITWASLAFQPYFTMTASNVGFGWWSHDIGGHFDGIEHRELYIRWLQLGVFSPIMRLHSTKNLFHKREPWRWDKTIELIATDYMRLRHQLIPYLYSMAKINSDGGFPLIRPLYYHHSKDLKTYKVKDTYYFGSELLVSPYTTPLIEPLNHSKKNIYLPKGDWFDYHDGSYYKGGKSYALYGTLDDIPLFAKAGAIIIKDGHISNDVQSPSKHLIIDIFPGASNEVTLYEDDGISKPSDAHSHLITIKTTWHEHTLDIAFIQNGDEHYLPKDRHYTFRIHAINEPTLNHSYAINSHYHKNTHMLEIIYDHLPKSISLSCQNGLMLKHHDAIQKLTDLLLESSYLTVDKQKIGYVYKEFNQDFRGIIGSDLSLKEMILSIKKLDIPKTLKKAAIDILARHQTS